MQTRIGVQTHVTQVLTKKYQKSIRIPKKKGRPRSKRSENVLKSKKIEKLKEEADVKQKTPKRLYTKKRKLIDKSSILKERKAKRKCVDKSANIELKIEAFEVSKPQRKIREVKKTVIQTPILSKITETRENIENINKKIIQQSKSNEIQVSRKSLKTIQVNNEKVATKQQQHLMSKTVTQTKITDKFKRKPSAKSSKNLLNNFKAQFFLITFLKEEISAQVAEMINYKQSSLIMKYDEVPGNLKKTKNQKYFE